MHHAGLSTGHADGTFRPAETVTRQAMAAFLHRLASRTLPTTTAAPAFRDVGARHPFRTEIGWLAGTGITRGYPDGTFRPTAPVSRDAAAAFLHRLDARR
jgi:hypothetical protein